MIKIKKSLSIIGNIGMYLLLFLCVIVVIFTVTSKKDDDGMINILNYQLRLVTTDSMAKCKYTDVSNYKIKSIPKNSLIIIKLLNNDDYDNLQKGDVLTFKYVYTEQVVITHRIDNIIEKNDGDYIITLIGDNKNSNSELLKQTIDTSNIDSPNYIIGKVVGKSIILGLLMVLFKSPICLVFIIIIPCVILIILEVLKIIKVINFDKLNNKEKVYLEKDLEIEQLKKKILELESNK